MPRQSPYEIKLSKTERGELLARSRRYTSRYRDVIRAKIVLLASEGMADDAIAARPRRARRTTAWRATCALFPPVLWYALYALIARKLHPKR